LRLSRLTAGPPPARSMRVAVNRRHLRLAAPRPRYLNVAG
jgi:hypothetical protein